MTDHTLHYTFTGPLTVESLARGFNALKYLTSERGLPLDSPVELWRNTKPGHRGFVFITIIGSDEHKAAERFALLTHGWIPAFFTDEDK